MKIVDDELIIFEGWYFSSNYKKFVLEDDVPFNMKFRMKKEKVLVRISSEDQTKFNLQFKR